MVEVRGAAAAINQGLSWIDHRAACAYLTHEPDKEASQAEASQEDPTKATKEASGRPGSAATTWGDDLDRLRTDADPCAA